MEERKLVKRKRKALTDGNKTMLITSCIQLAEHYFREGGFMQAINEYKLVAEKYKEMGKLLDYARANRMVGEAYTHLRQYLKALKYQQIHLDVAKAEKDKLEEQRALATIGHTYLTSYLDVVDNPDKTSLNLAYSSFRKSLDVCEILTGISKREHMDMTARLFANLGVVQECLGNYDKGIELIKKSVSICKTYDIYEQLERGYTFLGSLYAKKEDFSNAIHQYNLAIEVASRLDDKVALISATSLSKADILIKLSDLYGAKAVLLKAYKLKNPNVAEHSNIERTLKIVTAMCYTEDALLTASDTDYATKKKLYDKMGDGASSLRNYSKAIEYYQKMLEAATKDGDSGKGLCPCYISLAQSYSDNRQYDLAIEYFEKEYNITKDNVKEGVSTLFSIVDTMELAGRSVDDKEKIYKTALQLCREGADTQLEGKTLIRYINLLKKNKKLSQINELEQDLIELGYVSSDSESEEEQTPDIGVDICVDDITDMSDGSEAEQDLSKPRTARRRNKGFVLKRNNKGETQLHTACIAGNASLVRRLLDQGHVVNIRDNCGWLPIHEACICGHLEIVTMLLNKGAAINDRGGTLCNGMTPLHDAASNGHLEVIELLLDRGANAAAKTDDGVTPLHILQHWYKTVQVQDSVRRSFYEVIVKRMMHKLEKSGHEKDIIVNNKENIALVQDFDDFEASSSNRSTKVLKENRNKSTLRITNVIDKPVKSKTVLLPTKSSVSETHSDESSTDVASSEASSTFSCDTDLTAKDEYKKVMENLRHRIKEDTAHKMYKPNIIKRPALLQPDEVGDDWLEDDIGVSASKKRKTTSDTYTNTINIRDGSMKGNARKVHSSELEKPMRRDKSPVKSSLSRNSSASSFNQDIPDNFFDSDFDVQSEILNSSCKNLHQIESDSIGTDECSRSSYENAPTRKNKKKIQTSLISAGFSRNHDTNSNNFHPTGVPHKHKQQTKLTNFTQIRNIVEADSTTSINLTKSCTTKNSTSTIEKSSLGHLGSVNVVLSDPTLSVDVRIDGRLYRVPVPLSETHTLTIKWLAAEAAQRYCRKECVEPTLELETKNGAILADEDLVSILFPLGGVQAEEVNARILKYNLPPLIERYKKACINMNIDHSDVLLNLLQDTSVTLDLSNLYLRNKILSPLCKAVNRQSNIHHLNLSGNFMLSENIQLLCSALPSLENLTILNLSLNHLDVNSLNYMSKMFIESERAILENLVSLDLSYNSLKDDSLKYLAIITRYLKLRTLHLRAVDFTANIFHLITNRNVELYLDYLENFDISFNQLDKDQILKFVFWIKPNNIQMLDISRNNVTENGLAIEVVRLLQVDLNMELNLTYLDMSSCRVTDSEIYELLRLTNALPMETLNLSYNASISAVSLRRLIQHNSSLVHLNLSGCQNILKYFETCVDTTWTLPEGSNIRTLKLCVNSVSHPKECEVLINMWKNKYHDNSNIMMELHDSLELSVKN